jgi:hypothetical protein
VSSVISILISSDFLQMASLITKCIQFVKNHINEVVQLPIDMNCLNSALLKKIAAVLDIEDLDKLKDRRDKLVAKLFKKKLELLFDDESNALFLC